MRLVTDGENYAIRWGIWPFYMYFDMEVPGFWWFKNSPHYLACWTGNRAYAETWMRKLKPKRVRRVID